MIEQSIYTALTTGSPLPTSANTRVFPVLIPKESNAYPAISYQRVTSTPVVSLQGSSGLDNVRVQIDCWARTYKEVKALAAEVRLVMQSIGALPATDVDDYEPETKLYRVIMDFTMWQK